MVSTGPGRVDYRQCASFLQYKLVLDVARFLYDDKIATANRSKMRLRQFRKKLRVEVDAARGLKSHDQRIQPHFYCIAALLRKIISRTGDHTKLNVRVRPSNGKAKDKQISMRSLCGRILHSQIFLPVTNKSNPGRYCTIVSDRDPDNLFRRIDVNELLDAAEAIASDDRAIFRSLVRNARTKMNRTMKKKLTDRESIESLQDVLISQGQ